MKAKWDSEKSLEQKYEKKEAYMQSIQNIKQELNVQLDEFVQRDAEINANISKIEEMKETQKKLMEKCKNGKFCKVSFELKMLRIFSSHPSDQQIDQKRGQITSEMEQITSKQRGIEDKRDNLLSRKLNKQAELRMMENEVSRLENVKNQRLLKLQQMDKGVYQAVMWLRNNKHMFRGEINEPMMLEVSHV